jgi:LmeA-like phospholipid-binding
VKALVVLLVIVAVLLGIGFLADRAVERWAEGYVADQLTDQAGLQGTPDVDVRGFPFLTQALDGTYEDVRIALTADELGQPAGTTADVRLVGLHIPLSNVLSGDVQEVPVDRIEGTATLSYELLSDELGGDSTLSRDGDGLRVTKTVELLGYTLPLTASGTVGLDGDELIVDVERASGAGVELPDFLVDQASDLLDLRYQVPALPFGLQLTSVTPAADGVVVQVEAVDTVLATLE